MPIPLENIGWRASTNQKPFYKKLEDERIFGGRGYIWGFALALGYILKKRSEKHKISILNSVLVFQEEFGKVKLYLK